MALFIAIIIYGGAMLSMGFEAGQANPEANNILEIHQNQQ